MPKTKYMPSEMAEWVQSPRFSVMMYRKPETIAKEELFEEFMSWLEVDREEEVDEKTIKNIKALFAEFLDYDKRKVKQGESELLRAWVEACGGSGVKISSTGHRFVHAVHDFENCEKCKQK